MGIILPRSMQYNGGIIRANQLPFGTRAGQANETLRLQDDHGNPISSVLSVARDTPLAIFQLRGGVVQWLNSITGQNLLFPSMDFTSSLWQHNFVAATSDVIDGPGRLPWWRGSKLVLARGADAGTLKSSLTYPYNATAGTWYLASAYVKAADVSWCCLTASNADPGNSSVWFDLLTGAVGSHQVASQLSGIIPASDGWYRIWVATQSVNGSQTSDGNGVFLFPALGDGLGSSGSTYPPDGQGIYVAHMQLESFTAEPDAPGNAVQTYNTPYGGPYWRVSGANGIEFLTTITAGTEVYWSGVGKRGGETSNPIALSIYNKLIEAWDLQESSGDFVGGKQGLILTNTGGQYSTSSLAEALPRSLYLGDYDIYAKTNPASNLGIVGNVSVSYSFWWKPEPGGDIFVLGVQGDNPDIGEDQSTNGTFVVERNHDASNDGAATSTAFSLFWEQDEGVNVNFNGPSNAFVMDSPQFVAATRDASLREVNLYTNAELNYSASYTSSQDPDGGDDSSFHIGIVGPASQGGNMNGFAYYAGVWVYSEALTQEEVTFLYNDGSGMTFQQLKTLTGLR